MSIKLLDFLIFMWFLDFWHKRRKRLNKHRKKQQYSQMDKQTINMLHKELTKKCVPQHKQTYHIINMWSTQHTRESRNCTNTNGLTEWFKPWTIERLGEDVRLLIVGVNELETHNSFLYQIPNEMVTYLYVFRFWMLDRILGKIDGTGVVTKDTHRFLRNSIVMK